MDPALIAQDWMVIRHTMWNYVGLQRSERRLDRAAVNTDKAIARFRELQAEAEAHHAKKRQRGAEATQ